MDQSQDFQPPEFISTHPSVRILPQEPRIPRWSAIADSRFQNKHRQEKIQEWMPLAMDKRQQSACNGTQGFAEQFKRAMRQGVLIVS